MIKTPSDAATKAARMLFKMLDIHTVNEHGIELTAAKIDAIAEAVEAEREACVEIAECYQGPAYGAAALARARTEGYEAAREQAAKIAEDRAPNVRLENEARMELSDRVSYEIADTIRAMQQSDGKGEK